MKKLWLLLLPLLLAGCTRLEDSAPVSPNFVTGISVWYDSGAVRLSRDYTSGEKMQSVLTYIRCLQPYGTAEEDPETAEGSYARITLRFTDGTEKVYEQRSDRYFRLGDGPWQNIREERGQELALLIGLMESDAE